MYNTQIIALLSLYLFLVFHFIKWIQRNKLLRGSKNTLIAFFHPYCDGGGGGERVLWIGIQALLDEAKFSIAKNIRVIIYYGGNRGKDEILKHVKDRFDVSFSNEAMEKIHIIYIKTRTLLEPKWYPVATMFFQSLASIIVGLECLFHLIPDIFADTMGAAFIFPFAKFFGSSVYAYVHYPIISSDMLNLVRTQRPSYNNDGRIASSLTISSLKLGYYRVFAWFYGLFGSTADVVSVNSTWTANHIKELWKLDSWYHVNNENNERKSNKRFSIIYPPCNTTQLVELSQSKTNFPPDKSTQTRDFPKRNIISIGQFRPEKDHALQIRAFKRLKDSDKRFDDVFLTLIGSTRNETDEKLVNSLKTLANELEIPDSVIFEVNQPYSVLMDYMVHSSIGLHTMWNEHFGISVVEMLAVGLIVIAHCSGGPKLDIIQGGKLSQSSISERNGYLADTEEEYSETLSFILDSMEDKYHLKLKENAKNSVERFSDELFGSKFCEEIRIMVESIKKY